MRHFRPTKSSLCLLLTLAVSARSQQLGVYLGWVGTYPGNRLQEGSHMAKKMAKETRCSMRRRPIATGRAGLAGLGDKSRFGLYDDHAKLTAGAQAFLTSQPSR